MAEERALDFAAALARILRDHKQSRVWIGGELRLRPKRTRSEFGGRIRSGMEMELRGRSVERNFAHAIAAAPCREECLLRGQNAIETGKQEAAGAPRSRL